MVQTVKEITSYLTDRKQKIEIKSPYTIQSTYSNWETKEHGVPQGSIFKTIAFHNLQK
jgi:hypothetical protein